ncbi:type II toxin-antitoxin system prevent-host-death family antitoxin [Devosia sp. Leaf420]|uniref:type II toxin-antitoxin system prevent-host-death family antitoxin n=1 Tax=Devosia sp. Leaf420 TaxID=1736374 RepID=UPI0009EAEC4B|nr:type II toxin-antitoxin system prevent-host-death family antitoxin [Devosia sp. Leaf420]
MKEFSLSDLNRRSGEIADAALAGPVVLTKHGRRHLVLLSADQFDALRGAETEVREEDTQEPRPSASPRPSKSKFSYLRSVETEEY